MYNYDVIIIGGGPAGLTAGLYLSRGKHQTILLERESFGGYLAKPLSFNVDKHSGKLTSQVGPSYDSPFDIYP